MEDKELEEVNHKLDAVFWLFLGLVGAAPFICIAILIAILLFE